MTVHCWCGWSGEDSVTQCPNAAAHPTPSLSGAASVRRERERLQTVAGGVRPDWLRGPVQHFLSHKIDVYQTDDGTYVTADGRRLPGQRKGLR